MSVGVKTNAVSPLVSTDITMARKHIILFLMLMQICETTQSEGIAEGKSSVELEKEAIRHWENLVDKFEDKNFKFYSIKEHPTDEEEDEELAVAQMAMTNLVRAASSSCQEAVFVDSQYVQSENSYLTGLPQPD